MRKRTIARECALKILYQKDITKWTAEAAAQNYFESQEPVPEESIEFTMRLILGVCKHLEDIDAKISRYATNWQLKRMAIIDRNILRLGVFELYYADDIPPKVTINESVELAKKFGDIDSSKFVNGILDKIHKSEIMSGENPPAA